MIMPKPLAKSGPIKEPRAPWRRAAFVLLVGASLAISACGHLTSDIPPASALTPVPSGNIGCLAPSRPASAGGCVTTDAATGISVRVAHAYADVTGTLVHLVSSNTYHYPLMLNGRLSLKSGYVLQGRIGGYSTANDTVIGDEPLPTRDIAPNVEIVATATFGPPISSGWSQPTYSLIPPWVNRVNDITIRVPFAISPLRAGGFNYHLAPTVEQGIGVQVQSLDYSPAQTSCFGQMGGARVEVRFTGLPADLELLSFILVESRSPVYDSKSCGTGNGSAGDNGPGTFTLTIPGMSLGIPNMTLLQSPKFVTTGNEPSSGPTVGAAGIVEYEVAFPGTGAPTGQPAMLAISDIQALTGGLDGASPSVREGNAPTLPTYHITLPMR
jgi:hypothetical protein